ncbi:MAG: hypothetical protein AAF438_14105, partial [Pseudomonadota bacterium]
VTITCLDTTSHALGRGSKVWILEATSQQLRLVSLQQNEPFGILENLRHSLGFVRSYTVL